MQLNFLQLLNSDAIQRVTVTHLKHYHSSIVSSIESSEVDRLEKAKAHQLDRLTSRSLLLFRGPGKELLGVNEKRAVVIQSTCEVCAIVSSMYRLIKPKIL